MISTQEQFVQFLLQEAAKPHTWQDSTDPMTVREVLEWLADRIAHRE